MAKPLEGSSVPVNKMRGRGRAPILSVCIATRNRAQRLDHTVKTLLRQIRDDVEIVVVDGASTDKTQELMHELKREHTELKYFRESTNSGVDGDYDKAVTYASGEYCWLLTDDDEVNPGALDSILKGLETLPALLVVNASVERAGDGRKLVDKRLPIDKDVRFLTGQFEEFFTRCIRYLSYIGAVVIRRDLWLTRERRPYFGSAFVHLGVIFQKPILGEILVLSEPFLSLRYGEAGWHSRAFEIWVVRWPKLIWSFDYLSRAAREACCPEYAIGDLRYLLLYRALGRFGRSEYHAYVSGVLQSKVRTSMALLVAHLPVRLINFCAWTYFRFVSRGAPMLLYDLKSAHCFWASWWVSCKAQ